MKSTTNQLLESIALQLSEQRHEHVARTKLLGLMGKMFEAKQDRIIELLEGQAGPVDMESIPIRIGGRAHPTTGGATW